MRQILFVLLIGLCAGCLPQRNNNAADGFYTVEAFEAYRMLNEGTNVPVVIDVRTPQEFSDGHIAVAENLDFYSEHFYRDLTNRTASARYLIICQSGKRSTIAAQRMAACGFTNVYNLQGGMNSWRRQNLPRQ